ncbi:hypothetical protein ACWC5I_08025, partial [Kitasatospora sp. NPDC001574]
MALTDSPDTRRPDGDPPPPAAAVAGPERSADGSGPGAGAAEQRRARGVLAGLTAPVRGRIRVGMALQVV